MFFTKIRSEVLALLVGVTMAVCAGLVYLWTGFLDDPSWWRLQGLIETTATVVAGLVVFWFWVSRSCDDSFYHRQDKPKPAGRLPLHKHQVCEDEIAQGARHGRSHRTFGSAADGHLARLATAFGRLLAGAAFGRRQLMLASA